MHPFRIVSVILPALLHFTARADCQNVDVEVAVALFEDLTDMASALTTEATELNPLQCAPIPIIRPNSAYDVLADHINGLVKDMEDASNAFALSAALLSDGNNVFLAYYDLSLELRRFLATLNTKSCSTAGKACSTVPTIQDKIKTALGNLKNIIPDLAYTLTDYLAGYAALAISGISDSDQLFCQIDIASFGGALNLT